MGLYEDTVQIGHDGPIFDDYSIIDFHDSVVIVATDINDKLITIREYKYAIDKVILGLPAGGIEAGYSVVEAAKKELLEETGYQGDKGEVIHTVYTYPSKICHKEFIVRIKNARRVAKNAHEDTELIIETKLIEPADIKFSLFEGSYSISALASCQMLVK